jgi:hypothetical protein
MTGRAVEQVSVKPAIYRRVIQALTLGGVFALAGCDVVPSRYRARMTVEVETPQGLRSGSSVVEIRAGKALGLLPEEAKAQVELRGEAVAVELPGGETLFALLRSTDGSQSLERVITAALDPTFKGGAQGFLDTVPKLGRSEMLGRSAGLRPDAYPLLVHFEDIRLPSTVKEVKWNSLPASFGPGVQLKSIKVETTNDPIVSKIASILPWVDEYARNRARLNGSTSIVVADNDLANNLSAGHFTTEALR